MGENGSYLHSNEQLGCMVPWLVAQGRGWLQCYRGGWKTRSRSQKSAPPGMCRAGTAGAGLYDAWWGMARMVGCVACVWVLAVLQIVAVRHRGSHSLAGGQRPCRRIRVAGCPHHFFLPAALPLAAGLAAARLVALLAAGFFAGEVCSGAGGGWRQGWVMGQQLVRVRTEGSQVVDSVRAYGCADAPQTRQRSIHTLPLPAIAPPWLLLSLVQLLPWPWRWQPLSSAQRPSWWQWSSWGPAVGRAVGDVGGQ